MGLVLTFSTATVYVLTLFSFTLYNLNMYINHTFSKLSLSHYVALITTAAINFS